MNYLNWFHFQLPVIPTKTFAGCLSDFQPRRNKNERVHKDLRLEKLFTH